MAFKKLERTQLQAISFGKPVPQENGADGPLLEEVTGLIVRVQTIARSGSRVLFMSDENGKAMKIWSNRSIDEAIVDPVSGALKPDVQNRLVRIAVTHYEMSGNGVEFPICSVEVDDKPFRRAAVSTPGKGKIVTLAERRANLEKSKKNAK